MGLLRNFYHAMLYAEHGIIYLFKNSTHYGKLSVHGDNLKHHDHIHVGWNTLKTIFHAEFAWGDRSFQYQCAAALAKIVIIRQNAHHIVYSLNTTDVLGPSWQIDMGLGIPAAIGRFLEDFWKISSLEGRRHIGLR